MKWFSFLDWFLNCYFIFANGVVRVRMREGERERDPRKVGKVVKSLALFLWFYLWVLSSACSFFGGGRGGGCSAVCHYLCQDKMEVEE